MKIEIFLCCIFLALSASLRAQGTLSQVYDTIIASTLYTVHEWSFNETTSYITIIDSNGTMVSEGAICEGQKIGVWAHYYENSNLASIGKYSHPKIEYDDFSLEVLGSAFSEKNKTSIDSAFRDLHGGDTTIDNPYENHTGWWYFFSGDFTVIDKQLFKDGKSIKVTIFRNPPNNLFDDW